MLRSSPNTQRLDWNSEVTKTTVKKTPHAQRDQASTPTRKGAATHAVDSTALLLAERYPPEALSARSVKIVTSGRAKNRNGTNVVPTPREICIVSSSR